MKVDKLAKTALQLIQNKQEKKIIPFFEEKFDDKRDITKALITTQIKMKDLGGGFPIVGEQIRTIHEIVVFTNIATRFALHNQEKLTAGILLHNLASFCFPNMDDGVDEKLIDIGYEAALKDLQIRKEIGEKESYLWAKWLVGIGEFIKGEENKAIETLEEVIMEAERGEEEKSIIAWSKLIIAKIYLKKKQEKRKLAFEIIEEVKETFKLENDAYGLERVEAILKDYW